MSELKKPWEGFKNIFEWYEEECDKEITVAIDEHNSLALMTALGVLYETLEEGEVEVAKKRIHVLGEIVSAALSDNPKEIIEEAIVAIGMDDIDNNIEHFFEHHAEEYREDD
jgi:hypothetical protein